MAHAEDRMARAVESIDKQLKYLTKALENLNRSVTTFIKQTEQPIENPNQLEMSWAEYLKKHGPNSEKNEGNDVAE